MRPTLLFVCHPLTGHVTPVLGIASNFARLRGWHVAFLSSEFFRARIEAAGVQFLPLLGAARLDDNLLFDKHKAMAVPGTLDDNTLAGLPQSITDLRHQTLAALPAEWESVEAALLTLATQEPSKRLILVSEAFFYGSMPLKYGASLPPAVAGLLHSRTVCISITVPAIRSADLPPFGSPEPFDSSAAGRLRFSELWEKWCIRVSPLTELLRQKLLEAGATNLTAVKDVVFLAGDNYTCHDFIAQIGVPGFEYPRSDFPRHFSIVGIVPPAAPARPPGFSWWKEIETSKSDGSPDKMKTVVVVAQGTVETDPNDLILPTIRLLACRTDVLTIAILGARGARLPDGVILPGNARVADYLAYDAVLPHADLWIHNGGYGATMHGIYHGVAMVIAGEGQDKPENGRHVQHSGLGINLACSRPSLVDLEMAINTVMTEPKYDRVAKSMKEQAKSMNCFDNVEKMVLQAAMD